MDRERYADRYPVTGSLRAIDPQMEYPKHQDSCSEESQDHDQRRCLQGKSQDDNSNVGDKKAVAECHDEGDDATDWEYEQDKYQDRQGDHTYPDDNCDEESYPDQDNEYDAEEYKSDSEEEKDDCSGYLQDSDEEEEDPDQYASDGGFDEDGGPDDGFDDDEDEDDY
ncbi:hypothetical protein ONZ43_g7729 [Nemania bipapillata]|uniref:Uncharacterized protein n=1 Tax=Nemania bipapillata TaxID=110536 RepID=A0ACC2HP19_9PEZI|nr:hypothetical protein ONZ43_g7729 [Nemania bipapillata]